MVGHWDDARHEAHQAGDVRFERWRLGRHAGSRDIGVSRYRVAAGDRMMPLHVHADEEEIFFVLAGKGLLWQGDAVHEIGADDVIVHRAGGRPHSLLATDEDLDVIVFASGSQTHLTYLPRAGVMWAGTHWIPPDAPHPFQAEAAAGPPELPAPSPRPANVVALAEVPAQRSEHGDIRRVRRDVATAAGSVASGLKHVTVDPGARSATRHCHALEEEFFVVLDGDGIVELGDDEHPVRRGSIVARPPATGVAHTFRAGDNGLTLLMYGTREDGEVGWYPDSRKLYFVGVGIVMRVQPVDYWDGEE